MSFSRLFGRSVEVSGRGDAPGVDGCLNCLREVDRSIDLVLYDRQSDPTETRNLASDPARRDLVAVYSARLERLIDDEIGPDTHAWVTERPQLLGWPTWPGDRLHRTLDTTSS